MPKFSDIPKFTAMGNYKVDVSWNYLQEQLEHYEELDMDPDFQRGHVWNKKQRIAYIEYKLRGGYAGSDILINCPRFHYGNYDKMVLVDGKQRITSVLMFLNNEIPAFGSYYKDYEDKIRLGGPTFQWHVNDLKTRKEVLKWYLEINTGGTPHTEEEIEKVKRLYEKEK